MPPTLQRIPAEAPPSTYGSLYTHYHTIGSTHRKDCICGSDIRETSKANKMMPNMMPMAFVQPVPQVLACIYCGSQLCSTACYPTHKDQYTCHVWRCPGRNPVAVVQVPSASTASHAVPVHQAQASGSSRPLAASLTATSTSDHHHLPTNPQFHVNPPARHSGADTFRSVQQEHSPHQGM